MARMRMNQDMAEKYGGHRRQAALTEDQIKEVHRLYHAGIDGLELARRYGVGKSTIYRIVNREAFADITVPNEPVQGPRSGPAGTQS